MSGTVEDKKGEGASASFDIEKFRAELIQQQRESNEQLYGHILGEVRKLISERPDPAESKKYTKSSEHSADFSEFEDEIEALELDEKQTKSLTSLIQKIAGKATSGVTDKVKNELQETQKFEQRKAEYNNEVAKMYPDILNPSSQLHKESKKVYADMTEAEKALPSAAYIATMRAAVKLKMKPLDIDEVRAGEAVTQNGNGGGAAKEEKVSQKQNDFAANFGIKNSKLFEEKLKKVKARHQNPYGAKH